MSEIGGAAAEGRRVLIRAPFGRDAESVAALLAAQGYDAVPCSSLSELATLVDDRAGSILLTTEALADGMADLVQVLENQPPWSDVPVVLLTRRRSESSGSPSNLRQVLPDAITNLIILERPVGTDALFSAISTAMRSRRKQFDTRRRIEELARNRLALAEREAELRLVADSIPVLIGMVDKDLVYRFANSAYSDWFGREPEDVVGHSIYELMSEADIALRMEHMQRALAGESVRLELPWPRRDGSRREAEIRYLPRHSPTGEVEGFYVFVLDVTDRKQAAEELERRVAERTEALMQAETALRQSQKMEAVGQLTGGIAHDFNNMLTGIIGSLDLIKRRLASGRVDEISKYMDAAMTSAQRAAALTARLLAFSRRQSLDSRPLDVNALLMSLEELLRRSIHVQIELTIIKADDLPHAVADANQLENAVLNLTINARDAMPAGGRLTIETRAVDLDPAQAALYPGARAGRFVMIAVSDTGVGIGPELMDKIFDPFFTTKPIGQGTGLGLSMVYGFVKQSGGFVHIDSRVNEGTSVQLFLPLDPATAVIAEAPGEDASASAHLVLLVESEQTLCGRMRDLLRDQGYKVVEAADAQGAVQVLASSRSIDLLVADADLPDINGRQLAELARLHRPDLPILLVTEYAENAAIRAGFLGTNMDMVTKPLGLDMLAAKAGALLSRQT